MYDQDQLHQTQTRDQNIPLSSDRRCSPDYSTLPIFHSLVLDHQGYDFVALHGAIAMIRGFCSSCLLAVGDKAGCMGLATVEVLNLFPGPPLLGLLVEVGSASICSSVVGVEHLDHVPRSADG